MHPEMIRAIAAQQVADWQAEAQARLRVKLARQARRARRHGSSAPDPLAGVRVPDYVDGTFRPRDPAGASAGQAPGQARPAGPQGPDGKITAAAGPADSRGRGAGEGRWRGTGSG